MATERGGGTEPGVRNGESPGSGFSPVELIVFLALVGFFLVGVVYFVGGEFRTSGKVATSIELEKDGTVLMSRLRSLLTNAKAVRVTQGKSSGIELLADLDGDAGTGAYSIPGAAGLEKVVVYRPSPGNPRLVAKVYTRGGAAPSEVELTDLLDMGDPKAFEARGLEESGRLEGVRVEFTLRAGGAERRFSEAVVLEGHPFLLIPDG